MKICQDKKEVTIRENHWPLAVDLFIKWGYDVTGEYIKVTDIDVVTSELSAWGVPWVRTKWNY